MSSKKSGKTRPFTPEDVRALEQNPNVEWVKTDPDRIYYTKEFKERFAAEYAAGRMPTQIFRDAGFDPKMVGPKRIERAAAKWRKCDPSERGES